MNHDEALRRASAYCAKAERCKHDVEHKLAQWGVDAAYWEPIVSYLTEHNYLDEERYARAFARDKHRFSAWGLRRIAQELRGKRLPGYIISAAVEELQEEFAMQDKLLELMQRKLATIPERLEPRKRYERLMRYAAYKGYDYDDAQRIVEQLLRQE